MWLLGFKLRTFGRLLPCWAISPAFFFKIYLFILCMWVHCSCTDGCEPSCGCWEFEFRTSARSSRPCSFWPKDLVIIINKYTVAVFRHTRKGRQISLRVVVSHHVVAEGVRSHYGWLWATMWLLGFELRTFGRAVSTLICWAILPAQAFTFQHELITSTLFFRKNKEIMINKVIQPRWHH